MRIRRILRLGFRYFPALIEALSVVAFFRGALIFFKYRQIAARIELSETHRDTDENTPFIMAWAVKQAAKAIPFASCLTQALSLQKMLARRGLASVIRVGVKVDSKSQLDAHAWVVFDDAILLGDSGRDLSQYNVLTDLVVKPHD